MCLGSSFRSPITGSSDVTSEATGEQNTPSVEMQSKSDVIKKKNKNRKRKRKADQSDSAEQKKSKNLKNKGHLILFILQ